MGRFAPVGRKLSTAEMAPRPVASLVKRSAASRPARARNISRTVERSGTAEPQRIDFGPLSQHLGYYLRRLYYGYRKHFIAAAGDLDVQPREVGALFVIGLNPGLTPSQLSAALAMDGAQITAMLNMFDARGLVERRISGADGRSRLVYLTPGGEKMLQPLESLVHSFDRSFAGDSLTDAEMKQLIALLMKLQAGSGDR
jgi:DNA-binding MarR family transcriptional regulator